MDVYVKVFLGLAILPNQQLFGYEIPDLVFTSPIKIRTLLKTQNAVTDMVDEYVESERNRIQQIQEYVDTWKREHEARTTDKLGYLSNPLNVYHLFKKVTVDWQKITEKAKENTAAGFIDKLLANNTLTWPATVDLDGIQDTLLNIQNINEMKAADLAVGKIGPIATNFTLSYDECLALCKRSYHNLAYKLVLDWAQVVLNKYFQENISNTDYMEELMYMFSWASTMLGNYEMAYRNMITHSLLHPNDVKARTMLDYLASKQTKPPEYIRKKNNAYENMAKLCSGPVSATPHSDLRCRYNFKNSPFLTIAPLKEESLSSDPEITLFHNVIYDSEIDKVLTEATLKLQTKNPETTGPSADDSRLNDFVWFEDSEFPEMDNIAQRVTDMTSTHRHFVQPFQIWNYAVGGYHNEHSLMQHAHSKERQEYGARLTTVAITLNDVLQGGATIFPQIGMKVEPTKGDALVWFNIRNDSTEDIRVRHATCPLLAGYKWVLMRHINEKMKS